MNLNKATEHSRWAVFHLFPINEDEIKELQCHKFATSTEWQALSMGHQCLLAPPTETASCYIPSDEEHPTPSTESCSPCLSHCKAGGREGGTAGEGGRNQAKY